MDEWKCLKCDTLNPATRRQCEVCDLERFYSQAQMEATLQRERQRLAREWEQLRQEQARLRTAEEQLAAHRPRVDEQQKRLEGTRSPSERAETGAQRTPTAPDASTSPAETWVNSIGMTFVPIPAGKFMMGSNSGANNEKPVHEVRISQPYYPGQYEVTQGQWQTVMGINRSRVKGDANLPVETVSWEEVQEFIRRLNAKEGGSRYRLPTEAEWEYAARGGSTTVYSFGDDPR